MSYCPACQKNVSLDDVKHHQKYYHSSCFGQLQTGYNCPHCDKPDTETSVLSK